MVFVFSRAELCDSDVVRDECRKGLMSMEDMSRRMSHIEQIDLPVSRDKRLSSMVFESRFEFVTKMLS